MMVTDEEYATHRVFSELERYIRFYGSLAMAISTFLTMGTRAIGNIDSYVYSSIRGTLESILAILRSGRINDAYALLRKYYDSAIINVYSGLYLEDHHSVRNFIVEKINNWLQGREQLPPYREMSKYIRSSARLVVINDLLYRDGRYKRIRDRCHDHTHYNFFSNVLSNDNEIYLENRLQALDLFAEDVRDVFILHLAYVFFLNDHYMMSSDYVDALECGMTPEDDSQHWVAPFVHGVFDDILTKERPDIAATIRHHSSMDLS